MKTDIKPYLKSIRIEQPQGADLKQFPFTIAAIKDIDQLDFHPDVTFFVGENGSGKSTILEAIATKIEISGLGGGKEIQFVSRYGNSKLQEYMRCQHNVTRPTDKYFLRAESMYEMGNKLKSMGANFGRFGGQSLHSMSHGESFLSLLTKGMGENGLYLLDEPEAALSASRLLAALVRIEDLVNANCQFIIATHSPILLSYPRSKIYLFDEEGCRQVSFEETEHFKVTKDFLNNYPKRIQQLLKPTPLLDWLEENAQEN